MKPTVREKIKNYFQFKPINKPGDILKFKRAINIALFFGLFKALYEEGVKLFYSFLISLLFLLMITIIPKLIKNKIGNKRFSQFSKKINSIIRWGFFIIIFLFLAGIIALILFVINKNGK